MKYIYKNHNNYIIQKTLNHKSYYFGTYNTLEEAQQARDELIKQDWKNYKEYLPKKKEHKYIYNIRGAYVIIKRINGKTVNYGRYNSLNEARKQVKLLKKQDWSLELAKIQRKHKKHVFDKNRKYISKIGNRYVIYKYDKNNGKEEYYGSYRSFEDAQAERDALIRCNWDYDLLCETTQGEIR